MPDSPVRVGGLGVRSGMTQPEIRGFMSELGGLPFHPPPLLRRQRLRICTQATSMLGASAPQLVQRIFALRGFPRGPKSKSCVVLRSSFDPRGGRRKPGNLNPDPIAGIEDHGRRSGL
jgi:hypothetical protein